MVPFIIDLYRNNINSTNRKDVQFCWRDLDETFQFWVLARTTMSIEKKINRWLKFETVLKKIVDVFFLNKKVQRFQSKNFQVFLLKKCVFFMLGSFGPNSLCLESDKARSAISWPKFVFSIFGLLQSVPNLLWSSLWSQNVKTYFLAISVLILPTRLKQFKIFFSCNNWYNRIK